MSPRTGRPPKGEASRSQKLTIMLSEKELNDLNECAQRTGETRTDIIVEGIALVKQRLDEKK